MESLSEGGGSIGVRHYSVSRISSGGKEVNIEGSGI